MLWSTGPRPASTARSPWRHLALPLSKNSIQGGFERDEFTFAPGEVICKEGDRADRFFVMESGACSVRKRAEGSDEDLGFHVREAIEIAGARRVGHGIDIPNDPDAAGLVQHMIDADRSGVMFTCDPATGDPHKIAISALYGAGEGLVSAGLDADAYL